MCVCVRKGSTLEGFLEFLEGNCFEKHLKRGGWGGWPLEPFLFS